MLVRLLLPAVLLTALATAGCGGSNGAGTSTTTTTSSGAASKLEPSDIAVVGGEHISKTLFNELLSEAKATYKLQGQTFPKPGTSAYSAIRNQALLILVQQAETEAEAGKLGITVTDKDVEKQLRAIKQRCCNGDESKYRATLEQQGVTDQTVRDSTRSNLFGQRLAAKLTRGITVPPAAIAAYYAQHKSSFQTPSTRKVRYILLGKQKAALAATLLHELDGAPRSTWCTLAKKYSQDPSSSGKCGEATFTQGQTVSEFDKLLFSLPTDKAGKVDSQQYGWFVLEPAAAASPAKTTPLASASKKIKATILQTKRQAAITAWTTKTQKAYCKQGVISYEPGYRPSPDPCAASTATTTTTP
jgi:parvulin-like peptidyl-prolyl isomerase